MTFNGQTLVDKTKKGDPQISSSVGKHFPAAPKCKVSFFLGCFVLFSSLFTESGGHHDAKEKLWRKPFNKHARV